MPMISTHLSLVLFLALLPGLASADKPEPDPCNQQLYDSFPNFPEKLCPSIPSNVVDKIILSKVYETDDKSSNYINPTRLADPSVRARMKRHFELVAWQTFIGVNWPTKDGVPLDTFTGSGVPRWHHWADTENLFNSTQPTDAAPNYKRDG